MINKNVQSLFNDYKPMNEPTIIVEVNLTPDKMVKDLSKILVNEMYRVAGPVGERMLSNIDAECICKYLCTLSFMRRVHVVGVHNQITQGYGSLTKSLAVPTLWYQVLIGIGEAIDRDYSIKFIPGTSVTEKELLSPEEMLEVSDVLWQLQNSGLRLVAGIPIGREGELDFMAMAHVGEMVLSYRQTHPVYGFLAAFFASKEVSEALGALVRIKYGYDSDYQALISRVVASTGGEG